MEISPDSCHYSSVLTKFLTGSFLPQRRIFPSIPFLWEKMTDCSARKASKYPLLSGKETGAEGPEAKLEI